MSRTFFTFFQNSLRFFAFPCRPAGQLEHNTRTQSNCQVFFTVFVKKFEGSSVPMGYIDITRHRDDISEADKEAAAAESYVPCDINDKTRFIVDIARNV